MVDIRKNIDKIYRLSTLREIGIVGSIALALFILTPFVYKTFSNSEAEKKSQEQYREIDPLEVKNNTDNFQLFLKNIKQNNGVLVLGTSESGKQGGYNYWELLNRDPENPREYSVMYGAGRFCEKYIPQILSNPETWKGMNVYIFVNPTYWRSGLNYLHAEYQSRYLNKNLIESAQSKFENQTIYHQLFGTQPSIKSHLNLLTYNQFSSIYKEDISKVILGETKNPFTSFPEYTLDFEKKLSQDSLDFILQKIDTNINCTYSYLETYNKHPKLTVIDTNSNYRTVALETFFGLCEKYNINATYILGPYNGKLGAANNSKAEVKEYDKLISELQQLFTANNQNWIDVSGESYTSGFFNDPQHHSPFGGYLIYKAIKNYERKEMDN